LQNRLHEHHRGIEGGLQSDVKKADSPFPFTSKLLLLGNLGHRRLLLRLNGHHGHPAEHSIRCPESGSSSVRSVIDPQTIGPLTQANGSAELPLTYMDGRTTDVVLGKT